MLIQTDKLQQGLVFKCAISLSGITKNQQCQWQISRVLGSGGQGEASHIVSPWAFKSKMVYNDIPNDEKTNPDISTTIVSAIKLKSMVSL